MLQHLSDLKSKGKFIMKEKHNTIVWKGISTTEYLQLEQSDDEIRVDSRVLGVLADHPVNITYAVRMDKDWAVRRFRVSVERGEGDAQTLELLSAGKGQWKDPDGSVRPELAGCMDIDLSVTPFSNTLPLRRLGDALRQRQSIRVLYIKMPELQVRSVRQAYTFLDDRRYRYEGVDTGFTAELPVDADGFVIDYPGLFERLYPLG